MFGKYALPSDDADGNGTATGSAEDTGYPASNLIAPTATGHLNLPSRPAKLTTTTGWFEVVLPAPVTIVAVALIYPNLDSGLTGVTLDVGGAVPSVSIPIPIPDKPNEDDDWTLSPWLEFDPVTDDTFRLSFATANSQPIQVGRLLLLTTLRELETDVRYGITDDESRIELSDPTELGVETMYDLYNVQRSASGEFLFRPEETEALLELRRAARNRVLPWLLIPDVTVNDAWFVRFEDPRYQRTRPTIGVAGHPFNVREVSRGLPWP